METEATLEKTLFGRQPKTEIILKFVAEQPVGFVLFFYNYSIIHVIRESIWKICLSSRKYEEKAVEKCY